MGKGTFRPRFNRNKERASKPKPQPRKAETIPVAAILKKEAETNDAIQKEFGRKYRLAFSKLLKAREVIGKKYAQVVIRERKQSDESVSDAFWVKVLANMSKPAVTMSLKDEQLFYYLTRIHVNFAPEEQQRKDVLVVEVEYEFGIDGCPFFSKETTAGAANSFKVWYYFIKPTYFRSGANLGLLVGAANVGRASIPWKDANTHGSLEWRREHTPLAAALFPDGEVVETTSDSVQQLSTAQGGVPAPLELNLRVFDQATFAGMKENEIFHSLAKTKHIVSQLFSASLGEVEWVQYSESVQDLMHTFGGEEEDEEMDEDEEGEFDEEDDEDDLSVEEFDEEDDEEVEELPKKAYDKKKPKAKVPAPKECKNQ